MGFFSDLKNDLTQAVNEMTDESVRKELLAEEERLKRELSSLSKTEDDDLMAILEDDEPISAGEMELLLGKEEADEILAAEASVEDTILEAEEKEEADSYDEVVSTEEEIFIEDDSTEDSFASEDTDAPAEAVVEEALPEEDIVTEDEVVAEEESVEVLIPDIDDTTEQASVSEDKEDFTYLNDVKGVGLMDYNNNETTIISKGTIITGDLTAEGNVDLLGSVLGNIESAGKLTISGSVQGDCKAAEVFAQAAKLTGNVHSEGSVKLDKNTVVIGNVFATGAVIAGAVKGDIDVHGPVILDSSAIIMGNIKSKSVQINNGALIEGMCSQCYADKKPSAFFEGI